MGEHRVKGDFVEGLEFVHVFAAAAVSIVVTVAAEQVRHLCLC